jgi:hypothetical protein
VARVATSPDICLNDSKPVFEEDLNGVKGVYNAREYSIFCIGVGRKVRVFEKRKAGERIEHDEIVSCSRRWRGFEDGCSPTSSNDAEQRCIEL